MLQLRDNASVARYERREDECPVLAGLMQAGVLEGSNSALLFTLPLVQRGEESRGR